MTFPITGRCARTEMFGIAITTSSICVGARCPHARAVVGAVAAQNITDPHLATFVLDGLEQGRSAPSAIARVVENRPHIDYRQLTVVDRNGHTAHFTGTHILGTHAVSKGSNCIAAGNLLASSGVPDAMTAGFLANQDTHLAERLLGGLEAGLAAGGEEGPVHSAALLVMADLPFPLVDMRVDRDDAMPVARLRKLWQAYEGQMIDYLNRAINPAAAPSYGVGGDP